MSDLLTGEGLRNEVGRRLAASGFRMVENTATACMNNRAHIVERIASEGDRWFESIRLACDYANNGANGEHEPQVTLLPFPASSNDRAPQEIERMKEHGTSRDIMIVRMNFLIGFPDKRWTGRNKAGISPTNAELADPANWEAV